MKEYIERAVAVQELEVLRQEYEMHDDCDELVARRCRDALSAVPAADVAEVRHGRWEEADLVEIEVHGLETTRIPKAGLRCSRCSDVFDKELLWTDNYCPNCGALMKESEHEAN